MPLITAKTATLNAKKYFEELTAINEMSLEEVELSEDENIGSLHLDIMNR